MLDDTAVSDYLDRISAERPKLLDLDALRHLHERHKMSVPFDSLDAHFGAEVYIDERVISKVVYQRRGGGCYELNTAFYLLLQAVGFDVTLREARIRFGDKVTPPYHHMMMSVEIGRDTWVADVAFGKGSRYPIPLDVDEPFVDPHGVYSTQRQPDGSTDVIRNGIPLYRFSDEPAELADFRQTMWWYTSSPRSPFLQNMFCFLPLENGWVSLRDDELTVATGTERKTEKLADDAAVLEAYEKWFGMRLEKRPTPNPCMTNLLHFTLDDN